MLSQLQCAGDPSCRLSWRGVVWVRLTATATSGGGGQALGTPRFQTLHWLCSYKGCGRTGDPERAPIQRRQPKTPQKKTLFPSESFQVDGSGGPAVAPILGTHPSPEIKNIQHTELESWVQTAALNWRARGCPGFACWLSLTK